MKKYDEITKNKKRKSYAKPDVQKNTVMLKE